MKNSKLFQINWHDFIKGALVSAGTFALTSLLGGADLRTSLVAGGGALITYTAKQFVTDDEGTNKLIELGANILTKKVDKLK